MQGASFNLRKALFPVVFKKILLLLIILAFGYAMVTDMAFQTVAAGVAIFLFGMLSMEQGFEALTGGVLKDVLARSTNNVFNSQLVGFTTTALMQSSSLVTVITISTLTAGLISLTAGIGRIFGAKIGTTTGAWIMAGLGLKVNISQFAMPMIVFGLILLFQKTTTIKGIGNLLAGIGFVFLGIHYMKEGFAVFSESFDLAQYAMPGLAGLIVYTLLGMGATVVMQSSHATLMITIAALSANQVSYDNALALAIGSNVGTTITALIGSLGANVQGKRLAWAHVLFNFLTGAIAILLIGPIKVLVNGVADFSGIAEDNWALRLATFHTIFNVLGVALMTPFIARLVRFLERRIKEEPHEQEQGVVLEPQYLGESALALPDAALEVLRKETENLYENVFEVVAHGINLHRTDILSDRDLMAIVEQSTKVMDINVTEKYYRGIKVLYSAIVEFATRAPTESAFSEDQMKRIHAIRVACRLSAEIVKDLSRMRPNLNKYMVSDNPGMREQYNIIRYNLAKYLRTAASLKTERDIQQVRSINNELLFQLKEQDMLANGTIDRLVRGRTITPTMASSLINDSAAATSITKHLIEASDRLLVAEGVKKKRKKRKKK
jgi:phosphate:Na+ symporter